MKIFLDPANTFSIEAKGIALRKAQPRLNGAPLPDCRVTASRSDENGLTIAYTVPALAHAIFGIEAIRESGPRLPGTGDVYRIRYWIEGLADTTRLDSLGLRFEAVEGVHGYLRNGYHSWDGTFYVEPERLADFGPHESRPDTGYAMTQLVSSSGEQAVALGFDRHDRFQSQFIFDTHAQPPALTILTLWDRRELAGQTRVESENLVVFEQANREEGLREWARRVASASPTPPRVSGPPITGWCSWYNLYSYITEENIVENLRAAQDVSQCEKLPMRVFQIDLGFTPELGDWLEVKPQFPRGMKSLLDDIRAAGFIPGLWIAPFMVGNRSHLFRDHPDWVLGDRQTGGPLVQWKLYGEMRWHARSEELYILDTTHPEAFDYLRQIFHVWRQEWGCEYFKTDFMHWGSEYGPDRVLYHRPGRSRIEIWRQVAEMIRQEIGEATWLGCGCPLWASVGLVHGIRISGDIGVSWSGALSAQTLLRDLPTRNFANHILWQVDPDCILLRSDFHDLTDDEVRSLAIFAGMSGGVMMTSDNLSELSRQRLRLWKLILPAGRSTCRYPLLGRAAHEYDRLPNPVQPAGFRHEPQAVDPVIVQVRSSRQAAAVFLFNRGDTGAQRIYSLAALGLTGPRYVFDWTAGSPWPMPVEELSITLRPHNGALLYLSTEPLTEAPATLPEDDREPTPEAR